MQSSQPVSLFSQLGARLRAKRRTSIALGALLGASAIHCSSIDPLPGVTKMNSESAGTGGSPVGASGGAPGAQPGGSGAVGTPVVNNPSGGMTAVGTGGMTGTGITGGAATGGAATGGAATGGGGGTGGATVEAPKCAPPYLLCEDFESYTPGTKDMKPVWESYEYAGKMVLDAAKTFNNSKVALRYNVEAGNRKFVDIVHQTLDNTPVLPLHHFGRMMLWTSALPIPAHWGFTHAGGPSRDDPNSHLTWGMGGMDGNVFAVYSARVRPKILDQYALRGAGYEAMDMPVTIDSGVHGKGFVPSGKWVCWEWEFDAEKYTPTTIRHWIDSELRLDVTRQDWFGPKNMTQLIIGIEKYQDGPAVELWVDDIIMSTARVGCPAVAP